MQQKMMRRIHRIKRGEPIAGRPEVAKPGTGRAFLLMAVIVITVAVSRSIAGAL